MTEQIKEQKTEQTYENALKELVSLRRAFDTSMAQESGDRWDNIGKPVDGLGELERMISKICGMTGEILPDLEKKAAVVMCADHGVVAEGVTQTGQEVTSLVAKNVAAGKSSVCFMARRAGADVFAVDMGMAEEVGPDLRSSAGESVITGLYGVRDNEEAVFGHHDRSEIFLQLPPSGKIEKGKIAVKRASEQAGGTKNIVLEPAMTREEAALSVCRGIESAAELWQEGYRVIVTGEMGIGNTTSASAVTCCLTGMEPEQVTGRGAGLSSEGLKRKVEAVRRVVSLHRPDPEDGLDMLSKAGGYEIAGMTGLFIGGAVFGIPVIIDGVISAASAVIADRICPGCRDFMLASHLGKEPAAGELLKILGLKPVIHGELALGEGTGGILLLPLLDMAMNVYKGNITFDDMHMDAYQRME